MLRGAFPRALRLVWLPVLAASVAAWFCVSGWINVIQALWRRSRGGKVAETLRLASALDLFYCVFGLGADARSYAWLGLHRFPKRDWASFVFPQEHPAWLAVFEEPRLKASLSILSDKEGLASRLEKEGVAGVPSRRRLVRGSTISMAALGLQSWFIKPNALNRRRGTGSLCCRGEQVIFAGFDVRGKRVELEGAEAIEEHLTALLTETDLLVQPLLLNHSAWSDWFPDGRLATLRIITLFRQEVVLLYALLEIPLADGENWMVTPVDLDSGKVRQGRRHFGTEEGWAAIAGLIGRQIPFWTDIRDLVQRAHRVVPGAPTVGWDVALAKEGPLIIEGNGGWNTLPPQALTGEPLLPKLFPERYA